jgi:hypothetical protein
VSLSAGPFFVTAEQRVALARQRFFGEGQLPDGLVPEALMRSWPAAQPLRRRADAAAATGLRPVEEPDALKAGRVGRRLP